MKLGAVPRLGPGVLLAALACPLSLVGQDARLSNTVDTTLVTVGDHVKLSVTVEHAPSARVAWPDSISLAPFEVLGAEATQPTTTGDRVRSSVVLTLAAFELGELEIPSFDVTVEGPGPATQTLSTDRFGIEVVSVGQDESGDIRDIRGPLSIPVGVVFISLWLIVLVAAALLAWWLYRRWRKRPGGPEIAPVVPPRPADKLALEALARIEGSDLLLRGQVKEYHIAVSEVLRQYVEARFEVPALEMTTREVMEGLRSADADGTFRDHLRRFLDQCDLVKFAKARPDAEASRGVLELGRKLVKMGGAKSVQIGPTPVDADPVEVLESGAAT